MKLMPSRRNLIWTILLFGIGWLWTDRHAIGEATWFMKIVLIGIIVLGVVVCARIDDWTDDKMKKWTGYDVWGDDIREEQRKEKEERQRQEEGKLQQHHASNPNGSPQER